MPMQWKRVARRARFFVLERLVLPLAAPLLRLLVATWRRRGPDDDALDAMMRAPRVVVATFHGMLLQLLALRRATRARRIVVMLSPSLDGRLLAAALRHFDVDHVYATSGSRGVTGSRAFIRRVVCGDIGIIAADGPRGPCGVAKPGFLQIAAAAQAHICLAVTAARHGITFGSWDRARLPAPLTHVEFSLQLLPPPVPDDDGRGLEATQTALLNAARAIGSSVLPPAASAGAEP